MGKGVLGGFGFRLKGHGGGMTHVIKRFFCGQADAVGQSIVIVLQGHDNQLDGIVVA